MKVHKIIASLLYSAMLSFSTQGCAEMSTTRDSLSIPIPADTAMVVVFSHKGETRFLDRDGKRLPPCQFCDEALEKQLGPGCRKAEGYDVKICPGTVSTDIKGITPVSLYRTTGSGCYGGSAGSTNGGTCYDLCETFGWGCPP